MITFRVTRHLVRDCQIVEVLLNDATIATITPEEDGKSICLFSAHFLGTGTKNGPFTKSVSLNSGEGDMLPIPNIVIKFDPGHYTIKEGKIVKFGGGI